MDKALWVSRAKNITFRLVAPFPPVLTTAILFPRTSTNSKFNDREITFRVNITIFSEEKKSDWRICAVGARKFWVFEGLSARSSHESEISVPRGRWGGGVGVRILCSLTKSQVFLCLVALWIDVPKSYAGVTLVTQA